MEALPAGSPPRSLRHLREWYHPHQVELMEDWNLARAGEPLEPVPSSNEPLESRFGPRRRSPPIWVSTESGCASTTDSKARRTQLDALRGPMFEPLRDPRSFVPDSRSITPWSGRAVRTSPLSRCTERVRCARSTGA